MRSLSLFVLAVSSAALTGCPYHDPHLIPRDAAPRDAPTSTDDASPDSDASVDDAAIDAAVDASVAACTADDECDADACETARCVEGACVAEPLADATACDDGDLCTRADRCVAGACIGERLTCAACDGEALTTFTAEWSKQPRTGTPTADGGFAITGFGDGDLWVGAIDRDGVITRDRGYGNAMLGDSGYAITTAGTGELWLGGYSPVELAALPWLVRVAADGEEIASHAPFGEEGGSVHGILRRGDGSMVVLANVGGIATLAAVGADGVVSWTRESFEVGWAYGLAGLVALPGGDVAFAGDSGVFPDRHARVVRARATGEIVWDRTLDAESIGAIAVTADGRLIVGGQSSAGASGTAWLAELNAAGGIAWEQLYGDDVDGAIAAIGIAPEGFVLASSTRDDAWILRTDDEGVLLEEATFALGGYESATVAHVETDGTILIAGSSDQPGESPTHAWIARIGDLGELACPAD